MQQSTQFAVQYLRTGSSAFNAAKLTYHPKNPQSEIGLEFYKSDDSLQLFLILRGKPLKVGADSKVVQVTLSGDGEQEIFTAYIYEGGQKLLASFPLQETLLKKLQQNSSVTLHCHRFTTTLDPQPFAKAYAKFQKIPLELPIQLGLE